MVIGNVSVLGLLAIELTHRLDLPGTMSPSPVQGALPVLLILGCLAVVLVLVAHSSSPTRWLLVGCRTFSTGAYVLTRTGGLPFDMSDSN
jgi:hypothetical protein